MENYEIYTQIFSSPQQGDATVENFLTSKRRLMEQINPRHTDQTEVDMIYGFLNPRIREKIPRNSIKTFNDLLERAKEVEKGLGKERRTMTHDRQFVKSREQLRTASQKIQEKSEKTREELNKPAPPEAASSQGLAKVTASMAAIKHLRPGVMLKIEGRKELAFLNTSSNVNIASTGLFQHLKKSKCVFKDMEASINDFTTSVVKQVHVTTVDIILEGQTFHEQFLYFDDMRYKVSILGYEFINRAKIWMHLNSSHKWVWGFANTPKDKGLPSIEIDKVMEDDQVTPIDYLSVNLS